MGQQMSTTLGGTRVWCCSIAGRLEEAGRGALCEVLEDRAQPRTAYGWQPDQGVLERSPVGPERVGGEQRERVVAEDVLGYAARRGNRQVRLGRGQPQPHPQRQGHQVCRPRGSRHSSCTGRSVRLVPSGCGRGLSAGRASRSTSRPRAVRWLAGHHGPGSRCRPGAAGYASTGGESAKAHGCGGVRPPLLYRLPHQVTEHRLDPAALVHARSLCPAAGRGCSCAGDPCRRSRSRRRVPRFSVFLPRTSAVSAGGRIVSGVSL
ncbi:hypothetical protein FHS34_001820 [Streptomyces echinatus]|uniref:Uncharacterized protein n=1 Tax=Streptomyces echinatus TaxID=67293 RepID=A0A7W9PRL3_9ACTN|nr:hypothetical protein [Streptomyces echinatus]